jgi:hypothetical protein
VVFESESVGLLRLSKAFAAMDEGEKSTSEVRMPAFFPAMAAKSTIAATFAKGNHKEENQPTWTVVYATQE